ncbi:MAG: hypothetical protein IJI07_01190 [Flexilinea sp.]|nr:hypothetical protein [Flexilinea sp.]
MTLKQAFEVAAYILLTMKNGEIRLLVRDNQIKYVNKLEEVRWMDLPPDTKF